MQGYDEVPAVVAAPRYADISNDADDAPTLHKHPVAVTPYLVEFVQESTIVFDEIGRASCRERV